MAGPVLRRVLGAAVATLPLPALAQRAGSPMAAGFADWMARHRVQAGAVALALEGRLVLNQGFGGGDPAKPIPIWSLSKFVTGLAVGRLIAQGRLGFDMPLGRAMPRGLAAHRATGSSLAGVTIGQFLSHRSGLPQSPGGQDVPGLTALLERARPGSFRLADLAPALLAARPQRTPGEAYEYSNSNFLILGLAIEEVTGEAYGTFVAREVLQRAGIRNPHLDPNWGVMAAGGGWAMSGIEYLALMLRAFADDGLIAPAVRRWMEDPAGKQIGPRTPVFYSLGLLHRPAQGGFNHWHNGAWRFGWPRWGIDENTGTFAVLAFDRAAWFATYRPIPDEGALGELDGLMWTWRREERAEGRPDRFGAYVGPMRRQP